MATETVTYYFNDYSIGEAWTTTPANMVDGNTGNYATETNDNAVQYLTGNTGTNTYLGKITTVELRVFAKRTNPTPLNLVIRPVFSAGDGDGHSYSLNEVGKYSVYYDITTDTNSPDVWSWADVVALDCDVEVDEVVAGNTLSCSDVQIRVTYDTSIIRLNYNTSNIYLTMPSSLVESTVNDIENIVFNSGNDVQLNHGKTSDSLTLAGLETSSATANMDTLNGFMDSQYIVTLSGLPDTYLNTEYRISSLDFSTGFKDRYNYNITLERVYDRLG